jgi:hypothetical protein
MTCRRVPVKVKPLTWKQVLADARRERETARRRVRKLTSVIRDVERRIAAGESLERLTRTAGAER